MPAYEHIRITRDDRTATVTINRPHVLNAFNAKLHTEMAEVFTDLAADPNSDVIVLTGAGRAFSAGGDLNWQQDAIDDPESFETTCREAKQIIYSMLDCEKPIIGKINGPAVGLGATIALFCDLTVMARSAYIADPHVNVGMVAGDGAAVIWPQLIGFMRAKEYLFLGDRINAEDAGRIGLVNHVVDDDRLGSAVDDLVGRMLAMPQKALRWTKLSINVPLRQLASCMMDVSLAYESMSNISKDHVRAVKAFREKRTPKFGPNGDDI